MSDSTVIAVGVVVPIVVLLLVALFLKSTVYIVHQAEGIVIERFGRFNRVLTPGLNFVTPLIESPRVFNWRKTYVDINRVVKDVSVNQTRIDLRESVFNFFPQAVYTKDTVPLKVNCVMYYSIADVRKAIYEVDDLTTAVSNTAQTQLKEVFGSMTFSDALASQELINEHMKRNFNATFEAWGLAVQRIELQDMTPSAQTSDAMKKQMVAERERRADFIEAEGNKAAMRLRSEGEKIKKINMGVAEQEATRKRSEGRAQAQVEIARAEKASLDAVADAITADNCTQTEYMIAKRYNELFRSMVQATSGNSIFLPYEVQYLSGMIMKLPSIYGKQAVLSSGLRAVAASSTTRGKQDEFDDLN